MSSTYKRLINEYIKLNDLNKLIKQFKYKIFVIENNNLLYKTIIEFTYNNIPFNV